MTPDYINSFQNSSIENLIKKEIYALTSTKIKGGGAERTKKFLPPL